VACSSVIAAHPYLTFGDTLVASAHQHLQGESVDAAAGFVREQLNDFDGELVHSATLLTSELVSNGILHAGGAILLGVPRLPEHVLVTVADDNHMLVPKQRPRRTRRCSPNPAAPGSRCGPVGGCVRSGREDDASGGTAGLECCDGSHSFRERKGGPSNRPDLSGGNEVVHPDELVGVLLDDECLELLRHERRKDRGPHLALNATNPPVALAARAAEAPSR